MKLRPTIYALIASLALLSGCIAAGSGTGEFYIGFRSDNILVAGQKASDDKGIQSSLTVDPSQLILPNTEDDTPDDE